MGDPSALLPVFSPTQRLRPQLALASHDIQTLFESMDSLLDDGYSVKEAMAIVSNHADPAQRAMEKLIYASLMSGYKDGLAHIGSAHNGKGYAGYAAMQSHQRAADVQSFMNRTTKRGLKKNIHNQFLTSGDRADRAVRYEAANHYYSGLLSATQLTSKRLKKSWLTTSDDPCPECIENEDAGWLALNDEFPSGDQAPLLHLNCACLLSIQPV